MARIPDINAFRFYVREAEANEKAGFWQIAIRAWQRAWDTAPNTRLAEEASRRRGLCIRRLAWQDPPSNGEHR
jgi:hypothetical protein